MPSLPLAPGSASLTGTAPCASPRNRSALRLIKNDANWGTQPLQGSAGLRAGPGVACWNANGKQHRDSLSVGALPLVSVRVTRSPPALGGRNKKRDLITQHQSLLTSIARCDSAGYEGWKLTLKFPWQTICQICLHPRSHVLQTCSKFSSVPSVS